MSQLAVSFTINAKEGGAVMLFIGFSDKYLSVNASLLLHLKVNETLMEVL